MGLSLRRKTWHFVETILKEDRMDFASCDHHKLSEAAEKDYNLKVLCLAVKLAMGEL